MILRAGPEPLIRSYIVVAEAQFLKIKKKCTVGDEIPVPEIFMWRVDEENYMLLYIEPIQGHTLQDGWLEPYRRMGVFSNRYFIILKLLINC